MKSSFRRSVAWMGMSQAASFVVVFAGSVVLARLLSPYEMGVYAAAAAILGILATLRSFGLSNIIIREPVLTRSVATTAFTINTALCLLSSLLLLAGSRLANLVYSDPGIERLLVLLSLMPAISALEFLPASYLERTGAFQRIGLVGVGRAILSSVVMVVLAYRGFSYMSLAWGNLAAAMLSAICFNVLAREHASLRFDLSEWRKIGTFGLQMLTINVLATVVQRTFDLILGRMIGLAALGLWSRAAGLNSMLWDNIHMIVARVVFVEFSERRRRGLSLRDAYLRIVAILTAVLWPAFLGIALLAGPIIYTIYGEAWMAAATPLTLMSLAGVVMTSITMTWEVYIVQGEVAAQIRFQVKRTVLSAALFVVGCFGGLDGAAASRIADAAAAVLLVKNDMQRMSDTVWADYLPIYRQSALLTAAACLPTALLMQLHGWSAQTPITEALAAAGFGFLLWLVGLRRCHHTLDDEIRMVTRRMFGSLGARKPVTTPAE